MKDLSVVGKRVRRVDGLSKVTGKATYVDDLVTPGCLIAKVVGSPYAHARILGFDVSAAKKVPGVLSVLTARDIPGENQIGVIVSDQPLIAEEKVRYAGECVALIAAESEGALLEAEKKVKIKFEKLKGVFSAEEGLKPKAPKVHASGNLFTHLKVRKGNPDDAFGECKFVIERTYRTPHQEHMYLEPLGALAVPEKDGSILVIASMQCPYYVQKAVSTVLGIPMNRVRAVQAVTGGAFGGKEDVPSEVCGHAALLAWMTKRPVKLIYRREEDVLRSSKRHPAEIRYKMGLTGDGKIRAADITVTADIGAYATLSPAVLFRTTVHVPGPYKIPNVKVDTFGVLTNNPQCGAFRGFGGPQATFAHESMMDEAAFALGMDPIELRMKNALGDSSETPTGQILNGSVGLLETMEKARDASMWKKKRKTSGGGVRFVKGIGVACFHYGVSLGAKGKYLDASSAYVQVNPDGSVGAAIGGTELGQGAFTVVSQIVAEELGVDVENVRVLLVDTSIVPDSGPTVASRTTVFSGNAALRAASEVRGRMIAVAGEMLGGQGPVSVRSGFFTRGGKSIPFREVSGECYRRRIGLSAAGHYASRPTSFSEEDGSGDAYYVYSWGTQVAEVIVDTKTGKVEVTKVTAAQDVGKAINPGSVEGQIEGGVVQGIGYALYENFILDEGRPITQNLSTYIIPTALDAPEIASIIVEAPSEDGPFGAKGVGEPPIIPTAPAVANAVFNATGVRIREIPMTGEVVLGELRKIKK
ncbi:MAG: xanthine dehydrogenase family protein molybdopterin-binding subunit [Candidatus Eisenbacteria bacterium]|nr:xanthine dehydrogenase family protein molybdopterin-binding subunit [Candidatus Eisenbacteria bacterium]